MIDRFRDVARALVAVLLLGVAGAAAQTAQSPTSQNPGAVSQAGSPTAQAPAQPAGPAGPQINIAEITARANRDVGVNIETAINGWQHELDRLESALQKPRLRYSELNDLRDELQGVRAGIEDFWKRLEPRLAAAKDQVALLGPAPAAGQPPEPEQAALPKDQPKPNAQWQDGMSAVSTQREGRRLASGRGVMAKGRGVMAPTCNRPLR